MKKFTLIFCISIIHILQGWSQNITFHSLTTDDGLSQLSVISLYEDERGFVWAGTCDGLNMYNGNNIQQFKHEKNDPNTLISNRVETIVGDRNGKIFLRCSGDIQEYDFKNEKFKTILSGNTLTIYYNNHLYAARNNTVLIYDEQKGDFKLFFKLPNNNALISSILLCKNTFWIGTSNDGLYVTKDKKTFHQSLPRINISSTYQDSKGVCWVGSVGQGLFQFDGNNVVNHKTTLGNNMTIASDFIRECKEDNEGNIWIGTFNGLSKFNKTSNSFSTYTAKSKQGGLTHSSIFAIIKDQQGTMWVGTYFGGINYFKPQSEIFNHFLPTTLEGVGLSFSIVGKIIEDKYNNIWICTEGGGLNVFDSQKRVFKWYQHNKNKNSISQNNVKAIYYDRNSEIMWIGTYLGGLNRLELKTDRFTHYSFDENNPSSLPGNTINDIKPYKDVLIIATDNGVVLFNPLTGKCNALINRRISQPVKYVTNLLIDHLGTLWMTVGGLGVFSYNLETKKLKNYCHNSNKRNSISYNYINSIFEDSGHNLWFCTAANGLDLYHYSTDDFENFNSQNSELIGDGIFQVTETSQGKLLTISNQGISQFDCLKKEFINFNSKNIFSIKDFIGSSLYLSQSGIVYLGGAQGMVSFKEKDLLNKPKPYSIIPSRLFVNDVEVKVNDETGILKQSLYASPKISLPSKYIVFAIEFATTNFIAPNKNEIVYQLKGLSDTWTSTRNQKIITFSNLNPGTYTLVIKAKTPKDQIRASCSIAIEVLPPYYRTTFAYLLYVFLLAFIISYLLRLNNRKIKLEESLKYEQERVLDIENMNQAKLNYFTNISHEFRTPLTLIIGEMEMLLHINSYTPKAYKKMLSVYKNGIQLRELVNELLDFRKQEQGYLKIKVCENNIVKFLHENFLLFEEYAKTKGIKMQFSTQIETLNLWYDPKQLQKVINNLLSNALKYTEKGKKICFSLSQINNEAVIEVLDEGSGIAASELTKIFEPFYQAKQLDGLSNTGTGIGLALTKGLVELHHGTIYIRSELGIGTVCTVKLKLGKNHFIDEEISDDIQINSIDNSSITAINDDFLIQEEINKNDTKNSGHKMLIVEDNHALREMLVSIFENYYEVITAVDGLDGLEKVRSILPDIVLSDIMMPKMFGTELCREIKNNIETCHIPVVLLTARTATEHNLEGLRIGADDYITKPFNSSILITRCNNLVNSRIVLQEKFSKHTGISPQMLANNSIDKAIIDKVMAIVEKYINNPEFNINIFAGEMGMSRTVLFAKIKGITGQSPNDFVTTIRIKRAAFMLQNDLDINITEISQQLGYNSPQYFNRCFKNQYNVSPLAYRKGLKSDEDPGIG